MKLDSRTKEAIDSILTSFQNKEGLATLARVTVETLSDNKPSLKWSFLNQLYIRLSGTSDARGFRQWEKEGRKVIRGKKAIYISAPCMKLIFEHGKPLLDSKGKKVYRLIGFRWIPVFRLEDTEGKPLPSLVPVSLPTLSCVAERLGASLQYEGLSRGFLGAYNPVSEVITLCTHSESVFFHELAHLAHGKVLAKKGKKLVLGQNPKQEALADFVATVLSNIYGKDNRGNCYDYIKGYDEDPYKAVLGILSEAKETLSLILSS